MDKLFLEIFREFALFLVNGFRFWRRVFYLSRLRFSKVAIVLFFVGVS